MSDSPRADERGAAGATGRRGAIAAIVVAFGIGIADVLLTALTPVPLRYALGIRRVTALLGFLDAADVALGVFVADTLLFYLGTALVVVAYFLLAGKTMDYIDVRRPTLRDAGYVLGGTVLVILANVAVNVVAFLLDLPAEPHPLFDLLAANPSLVVVLLALFWLINAPLEELLYRNVVQKYLYGRLPRWGAVLVASLVFAVTHNVYFGGDAVATLVSLTAVFLAGLVFGGTYARTGNLLVPVAAHALTNSYGVVLFYLTTVGG